MRWIALFSQTGTEIYEVSKILGRFPDTVICNGQDYEEINNRLMMETTIVFTSPKPTTEEYLKLLPEDALITMHGWLRIVPGEVCEKRQIYNGHPGLITKYPELKGKDPQEKAVNLGHMEAGCVIHKAIAEVDDGDILMEESISIEHCDLNDVYRKLRLISLKLWTEFLQDKLYE
jgi:methionyl-tRNA formyltransferase